MASKADEGTRGIAAKLHQAVVWAPHGLGPAKSKGQGKKISGRPHRETGGIYCRLMSCGKKETGAKELNLEGQAAVTLTRLHSPSDVRGAMSLLVWIRFLLSVEFFKPHVSGEDFAHAFVVEEFGSLRAKLSQLTCQ